MTGRPSWNTVAKMPWLIDVRPSRIAVHEAFTSMAFATSVLLGT
jgi:hypothetical protein